MKKKVLAIALAVALIAVAVSGSIAYFTAEDQVNNTFTIGSVKIEVYENDQKTPSDTNPLGKLTPVVDANPKNDVSYMDKVVEVKNIGANDAYIRTHIAVPTALLNYLTLDFTNPLAGWTLIGETTATVDVDYTVYTYDHTAAVEPGEFTAELLQGVYLNSNVDLEEDANGNLVFILRDGDGNKTHSSDVVAHTKSGDTYTSAVINVLVASEAIQVEGFSGATAALNAGFGTNTNPWK